MGALARQAEAPAALSASERRQAGALAVLASLAPAELRALGGVLPLAQAQPLVDGILTAWPPEPIARVRRLHLTKNAERRRRLAVRDDLYRELAGMLWNGETGRVLADVTAAVIAKYRDTAWGRERGRPAPADRLRGLLHRLAGAIEASGEAAPTAPTLRRRILVGVGGGAPIEAAHAPAGVRHHGDDVEGA